MPKIHVHDFYFDYYEVDNEAGENDFCCSVNVYFNFSPEDPGDGWDKLEYFNVTVASPFGLAKSIVKRLKMNILSDSFFYSHIIIFKEKDEDKIMDFIRTELQSINGKSETEILLKAIRKFDWEYEKVPEVYNKLFR